MHSRKRSTIYAAALILMGAAGLLFAAQGLLTGSGPSFAGDNDALLLSASGSVPAPVVDAPSSTRTPYPATDRSPIGEAGRTDRLTAPGRSTSFPIDVPDATKNAPAGLAAGGIRDAADAGFDPTKLVIPKIGVAAGVVSVGTNERGEMGVPGSYSQVAWWSPGAQPGDAGKAVLAGHIDSPHGPAVFIDLDELGPGDEIFVQNETRELRYVVRGAALYRVDAAPLEAIFGPSSERELVLITCGGAFDRGSGGYLHRRVVFAVLAEDAGQGYVTDEHS